jgi:hypothetical protein
MKCLNTGNSTQKYNNFAIGFISFHYLRKNEVES